MKKTLITYASKYGSTAEIAESIASTLNEKGIETDICEAKKADSVENYDNVILGVALYMGQWRKDAVSFLKKNADILKDKKLWIFTSGPGGESDPEKIAEERLYPEKIKNLIKNIQPADITVFYGNINPDKLSGFEKWIMKKVKAESGDFRNWKTIKEWTNKLELS